MPGIIPNGALNSQLKPRANGSSGRASILAIEKVKIELFKGGTLSTLVVAETNNTGTYTWTVPAQCAPGVLTVRATVNYQKLPAPVAEFLSVPMEEAEIIEVNAHSTQLNILP